MRRLASTTAALLGLFPAAAFCALTPCTFEEIPRSRIVVLTDNQLDSDASAALVYVRAVRASDVIVSKELSELLYDIEALSQLAKYYAAKIRGATHLAAFRAGGLPREQDLAVTALEESLAAWSAYARAATANYHPQFLAKTRTIDWVRLTEDVRKGIEIARNPKPQ